jgi:predicted dehydrogenase
VTGLTRLVQVGTGGIGERWCREFLPPFIAEGRVEVVAAVDIDPSVLANAQEGLGLSDSRVYTDLERALDERTADAITIVVPPAHHEAVVDSALARGLDILSEKPIADTLAASMRIIDKVASSRVRMGITMSHRFDVDKATLRDEIRSGRNGRLDYLVAMFTTAARAYGEWSLFRHEMDHPMLVEGSVHHLDILADLAGSPCQSVWATTWRPPWAEYKGHTNVLAVLEFADGTRAQYEAATATAATLTGWANEYIRAECEFATLVLDRREVRRYPYVPGADHWPPVDRSTGAVIPRPAGSRWGHKRLIEDFLDWRDGGPPMETEVAANLRSMQLVAAAIRSSQTRQSVRLADLDSRSVARHG